MSNNQHFHDALVYTLLDVFLRYFTQFVPHNVDLSAYVKNLNITIRTLILI